MYSQHGFKKETRAGIISALKTAKETEKENSTRDAITIYKEILIKEFSYLKHITTTKTGSLKMTSLNELECD